jgi:hypothetical protein
MSNPEAMTDTHANPPEMRGDPDTRISEILHKLDLLVEERREREQEIHRPPRKDFWDKLQAAGALLVGFVGILFTFVYQTAERKQRDALQQSETVQRAQARTDEVRLQELALLTSLLPVLTSDDEQKKALAIRALSELGSPRLAAMLGGLQPSLGTAAGLNALRSASHMSAEDRAALDTALQAFPAPLRDVHGPIVSSTNPLAWNPPGEHVERVRPSGPTRVGGGNLYSLYEDNYGRPWAGGSCSGGWCARIQIVDVSSADSNTLAAPKVFGYFEDSYGTPWVGGKCSAGPCAKIIPVFVETADRT